MKTPKNLLFEHHHNAEPDLDQIRRDVLKSLATSPGGSRRGLWGVGWFLPAGLSKGWRWQMAGLAAAWVIIVALNLASETGASRETPNGDAGPNRSVSMAWREYRRQVAEALESQPAVAAAKPDQRTFLHIPNPKSLTTV